MTKGWAVALLRKHGALSSPAPANGAVSTANAEAPSATTTHATHSTPIVESRRAKLSQIIEAAREANASSSVIAALQADLDSVPEPKVGQAEMDQGRLLQLRAKQQTHHQAQLDTLNQELSAVQAQIEVLRSTAAKLQESANQLMVEHQSNLSTIDQAIANLDPQRNSQVSRADTELVAGACLIPNTAQVLSEALGKAVNDPSFFCHVPAEHQAIVKSFCANVTTAIAAAQPAVDSHTNAACALAPSVLVDAGLPGDPMETEFFCGISG